jgi:hypothetical protein
MEWLEGAINRDFLVSERPLEVAIGNDYMLDCE